MPTLFTSISLPVRLIISTLSRFYSPKNIVVDIRMDPKIFVQRNLKKRNLEYRFARKDQVITSQHRGWNIALGRKWIILTECYVDRRHELILVCKDAK